MSYSSIKKISGVVSSSENNSIHYDLLVPSANPGTILPVVLFVHGFKGFKDWGAFPDACEEIAMAGFAVVSFNLSLNGVGKSLTEFDEPELFARQTLSQDLSDVGTIIEAIKLKEIACEKINLDTDRVGIIGHSRGGYTAVAAAAEYPDIQCLITWSAVADYNARWSDQMKKDWSTKGYTEIKNSRTGQVLKLEKVVYEDSVKHADRLTAIKRVEELHIPSMFIAGKNDETVPVLESEKLYRACPADDKEIHLIDNAGHTFQVSHPFNQKEFPVEFEDVVDITLGWLREHLK